MSSLVKLEVKQPAPLVFGTRASEVVEVNDGDSYEFAVTLVSEAKSRFKEIDDKRVELKAPILAAGRAIDAFFKPALDFWSDEEKAIKGKLTKYINDTRAAERARQAELDRIAREEQDALRRKAAAAEKRGDTEKAEALREQAAVTGAADAAKANLKVAGGHTRKEWTVEVVDVQEFLRYALANPAYLQHVDINLGTLKRLISAGGTVPTGVKAECIDIPVIGKL